MRPRGGLLSSFVKLRAPFQDPLTCLEAARICVTTECRNECRRTSACGKCQLVRASGRWSGNNETLDFLPGSGPVACGSFKLDYRRLHDPSVVDMKVGQFRMK